LALWREFRRWRRNQDDIAALQALDARMLKDIGISRSEIMSVVTGRERDASSQALACARRPAEASPYPARLACWQQPSAGTRPAFRPRAVTS
jgi:uncharacterized protein YjiS (DUF1127 family)